MSFQIIQEASNMKEDITISGNQQISLQRLIKERINRNMPLKFMCLPSQF